MYRAARDQGGVFGTNVGSKFKTLKSLLYYF